MATGFGRCTRQMALALLAFVLPAATFPNLAGNVLWCSSSQRRSQGLAWAAASEQVVAETTILGNETGVNTLRDSEEVLPEKASVGGRGLRFVRPQRLVRALGRRFGAHGVAAGNAKEETNAYFLNARKVGT